MAEDNILSEQYSLHPRLPPSSPVAPAHSIPQFKTEQIKGETIPQQQLLNDLSVIYLFLYKITL